MAKHWQHILLLSFTVCQVSLLKHVIEQGSSYLYIIFSCLPCCYCYEFSVSVLQQDIVWLNIFPLEKVDQSKCKCRECLNIFGNFQIWQNASRNQNGSWCRYLCMACYENYFICHVITQQATQPKFRNLRAFTPKFPDIYLPERPH